MTESYSVRTASNKGVEYRDERDVYRFNAHVVNKKWTVYLPGSKGDYYQIHELTDDEQRIILPRIKKYLEENFCGLSGLRIRSRLSEKSPFPPQWRKSGLPLRNIGKERENNHKSNAHP
jgi:hypothetical protein